MSDSSLLGLTLQYFNATAQNTPTLNFAPAPYVAPTPTKNGQQRIVAPTGSPLAVSLAPYTTILAMAAKNLDPTNFVEVTWTYTDAALADHINVIRIPPLGLWLSTSTVKVSAGLSFLANTAPVSLDLALIAT